MILKDFLSVVDNDTVLIRTKRKDGTLDNKFTLDVFKGNFPMLGNHDANFKYLAQDIESVTVMADSNIGVIVRELDDTKNGGNSDDEHIERKGRK